MLLTTLGFRLSTLDLLGQLRTTLLLALVVFLSASTVANAYEPTSRYAVQNIEGWQVYVHRDLLPDGKHGETGKAALKQLRYGLAKARQMVNDGPLRKLQAVKIWLEVDSTNGLHGRTSAYQYHPDLDWLKEKDFHPLKLKCVEFGNAASLAKRSDFKTIEVTLHELAHAYHDQVLNFEDADVLAAHKRGREDGKYPVRDWVIRADHKEFFAGLTTRYFESEQRREEIFERDPVFARKLEQYWGRPKMLFDTGLEDAKQKVSDERLRFSIKDDTKRGRLHVKDGDQSVLSYNYGMQLNTGADVKYERGCYIHPLWDVNGWQRTITEDFPPLDGHLHHRGLGWTWPAVKVRGLKVQTWHPSDPPLRQHFVKWLKREADKNHATIAVENAWLLEDQKKGNKEKNDTEKVMTETVEIVMHPLRAVTIVQDENPKRGSWEVNSRSIDLKLTFEAVGGPIEISGGYGGLLLRGSADMKGGEITTEQGPLTGDGGGPHPWADLSHKYEDPHNTRGVAIFTPVDHPPHPTNGRRRDPSQTSPRWLLRTSYGGLMNVSWPGSTPFTLKPGEPLTLEYRIYVHECNAEIGGVEKAYADYIEQRK